MHVTRSLSNTPLRAACAALLLCCACAPKNGPGARTADDQGAPALLRHIPADAVFFAATLKPAPPAVERALAVQGEGMFQNLFLADGDLPGGSVEQRLYKLAAELYGKLSGSDGAAAVGLHPQKLAAAYSVGLRPVARVLLADKARFAAFLESTLRRLEFEPIRAERPAGTRFELIAGPWRVVLLVTDQYALATVGSKKRTAEQLEALLLAEPPAESLATSARVARLVEKHGFPGYLVGELDALRLTALLAKADAHTEGADVLAQLSPDFELSPECHAEIDSLLAYAPRLAFGTGEMSPRKASTRLVVETSDAARAALSALLRPMADVPLGPAAGTLLQVGVALDLSGAVRLWRSVRASLAAREFKCKSLHFPADQDAGRSVSETLGAGDGLEGALFSVDGLTASASGAPVIELVTLIRSRKLDALVHLLSASLPSLRLAEVPADGRAHALPPVRLPVPVPLVEPSAARTGDVLGLALGPVGGQKLERAVASQGTASTLLRLYFDAPRLAASLRDIAMVRALYENFTREQPSLPAGQPPKKPHTYEEVLDVLKAMGTGMTEISLAPTGLVLEETVFLPQESDCAQKKNHAPAPSP